MAESSLVNYEFMFGQLGEGHFGVISGSFRGHSRVIPESFWGHSGIIPESLQGFWGNFGETGLGMGWRHCVPFQLSPPTPSNPLLGRAVPDGIKRQCLVECEASLRLWFATGEMRSFVFTFEDRQHMPEPKRLRVD